MKRTQNMFDVIVVGGGHAGIEAALICAQLGRSVALLTLDRRAIGRMSCNPAIGGLAKGQMVRELDMLGGIMGRATDASGLQFKMLNRSKGRSVWSPRAQVDKRKYESFVKDLINNTPAISIIESEAINIIGTSSGDCSGIILRDGIKIFSGATILTCGTFLNGLVHIGERKIRAGRMGESPSEGLTEALTSRGLLSGRLKTGTPPRLVRNSIDWKKTVAVHGDDLATPFSYLSRSFNPPNVPCHTVRTGNSCKEIILENMHRSPLFSGDVLGVGPRYCPSIEDKVHRFPHHESHTLFLEPEWTGSDQIYTNGFSTSLPESIQLKALRAVPGLERVCFFRPGYAIEYDFFPPSQLKASLESKHIPRLFFAGQINGTSGYEEAAGQGLIAGINAVQLLSSSEPLTLGRDEAYLGVLIDDLITKDTLEPYRMFTSRAEYRILLRYTNTNQRLAKKARQFNLLKNDRLAEVMNDIKTTESIIDSLKKSVRPEEINPTLARRGETALVHSQPASRLLRRPVVNIFDLPSRLFNGIPPIDSSDPFIKEAYAEAETSIKYSGYIKRQYETIKRLSKQEHVSIPQDYKYSDIKSLSREARDKLSFVRPQTLGQAMRVSGVTPADISVLSVLLCKHQ